MSAAPEKRTVHIPEITSSLWFLFLARTLISIALVGAGVACLYFGQAMLMTSIQNAGQQNLLFEINDYLKITAGGFGAVVMAASLVPFLLAYMNRPSINLVPVSGGGYAIRSGNGNLDLGHLNEESNTGSNKEVDSSGLAKTLRTLFNTAVSANLIGRPRAVI